MGRRRLSRKQARENISISLPPELIAQFDKYLGENRTRSRVIERLINNLLHGTQKTLYFGASYLYGCKKCEFEGRSANPNLTWCKVCEDSTLFVSRKVEEEEE